jgi:hypothetical protein
MPNSKCQMPPNSEFRILNAKFRMPNAKLRQAKAEKRHGSELGFGQMNLVEET